MADKIQVVRVEDGVRATAFESDAYDGDGAVVGLAYALVDVSVPFPGEYVIVSLGDVIELTAERQQRDHYTFVLPRHRLVSEWEPVDD